MSTLLDTPRMDSRNLFWNVRKGDGTANAVIINYMSNPQTTTSRRSCGQKDSDAN